MAESIRTFDKLWISSDDSTYYALEFLDGSALGVNETFTDTNGIRGTRQHSAERVRRTQRNVTGTLRFAPTASELDLLLPWILGADESTDVFALAETVPARYLKTLRDSTKYLYDGVKVDTATFSVASGGPLTVDVTVAGVDETADGDATESDAISDDAGPYVISDSPSNGVTVGGTAYQFRAMQVTVRNFLEVLYNNSITPTAIHATDLEVAANFVFPFGDATALYGTAVGGVAASLALTVGNRSVTFALAGLAAPKQQLPFGGRGARDLNWSAVARRTGSTAPISITNDPTG